MDKIFNLKLAWHFDFHSHRSVRIGHAPDFGGMAKVLRASGIEEIIMFAKCHNGFSYYPTKSEHRIPRCAVTYSAAFSRPAERAGSRCSPTSASG